MMSSTQWDAVIFDYGGVLSYAPARQDLAEYARSSGLDEETFFELYSATRDYYGRSANGYSQRWYKAADAAGVEIPEAAVMQFIDKESELWTRPNPEVLALAREVRATGCRIAILSNMTFELLKVLETKFEWLDEFDVRIWSCQHGCAKPDESIYRSCLASLNCEAPRALFFDDRPGNVEAAKQFGIDGHVFETAEQARAVLARGIDLP
jgi:putative hydrolase of the HAD superfamily